MNLKDLITPEVVQVTKILAMIFSLFQLLTGLVLFRFIMSAADSISTAHTSIIRLIAIVHILVLIGILIAVILF
jgi:hypothetical protein